MRLGRAEFWLIFGILIADVIGTWLLYQMYVNNQPTNP